MKQGANKTLSTIDAALRRAEDLDWTDPGFLEWERGQIEIVATYEENGRLAGIPGPTFEGRSVSARRAMFALVDEEYDPGCQAGVSADEYPQETRWSGALLLGPEPPTKIPPVHPRETNTLDWLEIRFSTHPTSPPRLWRWYGYATYAIGETRFEAETKLMATQEIIDVSSSAGYAETPRLIDWAGKANVHQGLFSQTRFGAASLTMPDGEEIPILINELELGGGRLTFDFRGTGRPPRILTGE